MLISLLSSGPFVVAPNCLKALLSSNCKSKWAESNKDWIAQRGEWKHGDEIAINRLDLFWFYRFYHKCKKDRIRFVKKKKTKKKQVKQYYRAKVYLEIKLTKNNNKNTRMYNYFSFSFYIFSRQRYTSICVISYKYLYSATI